MTPQDIFGLFVRMVAVLFAFYGAYNVIYGLLEAFGLVTGVHPWSNHLAGGAFVTGVGAAVIRFTDRITAFAYPTDRRQSPHNSDRNG